MPKTRFRRPRVRALFGGATTLAMVLAVLIAASTAGAGIDGQGVGIEYSAPIQYLQVCGDDQYGNTACTSVEHVRASSTQVPTPTVWFVNNGSDLLYGADPPSQSPQWWFKGPVRLWAWSSYPQDRFPESTCNVPQRQPGNWTLCKFIIPVSTSPPPVVAVPPSSTTPPPPPPNPPPTPAPMPRARLSLHRSRGFLHNGQVVRLRGNVAVAPVPPGIVVELQAWEGRHRWLTFGVALTRDGGKFSYAYRFTRTTGVQVYLLRARLPTQDGYSARTVASHPVHITVVG